MNYVWEMKMRDAIRSTNVLHRKIKRMEAEEELDEKWIDREAEKRLNELKALV